MRTAAVSASVVLHAALLVTMSTLPNRHGVAAPKLVEMSVRTPPPPPPPVAPPPEPEKKKEEPPPPTVRPKLVKKRTVEKIVPDEPPPQPEPDKPKPPPAGFAVDMSNTSESGDVAVPAVEGASNMFGKVGDPPPDTKVKSPPPPPPSGRGRGNLGANSGYQVTKRPEFLGSEAERRPPYPRSAMEREIEGSVVLDVWVGVTGRVEKVRIVQRLDPACDEIAVKWAKERWRFKPGMAGDEPVGQWITVPVRFELDR